MIDALPTAEELSGMSGEEQNEVYNAQQAAYDAYEALTNEKKEEITGAEIFDSLFAFFDGMVNLLDMQEISIENGSVTITADTCSTGCSGHTITGTSNANTITVESGTHNIILQGVNIDVSAQDNTAAFSIAAGATVNLTLNGDNTLKSGRDCAGLQVPNGATLVITESSGGSLNVTGGGLGAGIGGGFKGNGGEITISGGTVTATGGGDGAGIGNGFWGADGTFAANGNAFIVANSISDQSGKNTSWKGVIFEGDAGQVYGDSITLTTDAEIPSGKELTIKDGQTLKVDNGVTLINNGTINVESGGKLEGKVSAGGEVNFLPPVEQFPALIPGNTYWFDLSGAGIPGMVNTGNSLGAVPVPDATLHWVPFTYVGTINAYSRNSEGMSLDHDVKPYSHSLFIADYNVTFEVSWDELNDHSLIFGKPYTSGGVDYTMRAPSVGSGYTGSGDDERGTPQSNEWDVILNKNSGYIKNWNKDISWGQDTCSNQPVNRAGRGEHSARYWHYIAANGWSNTLGFRPVLEILNPDTLASEISVVTLNLNGGKIGSETGPVNIVINSGEIFFPPSGDGLTAPEGGVFAGWTIGGTSTELTARWLIKPSITTQPKDVSVSIGKQATFTVAASGEPSPAYQWQVNKGNDWEDIPGATSSSYTTGAVDMSMNRWQYRCVAANSEGEATSNAATLTMQKRIPTVTAPAPKPGLTYNGTAQALINAGSTSGGTLQYSLEKNGNYSYAIPEGTGAGTYKVWYRVVGNETYAGVAAQSIDVTIAPKSIAGADIELGDSLTYTGQEQEQTVTSVIIDGLTATYDVSGNKRTDAGTQPLTVTGTGNFTGSETELFTIGQATNSITGLSCGNIVFGETPSPSATAGFGTATYAYSSAQDGTYGSWDTSNAAGTWYVKATVPETSNYTEAEATTSFTVTEAPSTKYTITATAGDGGSVTGGGIYAENASVTVTATAKNGYHFVKWMEGGNEVSTSASYTFTVTSNRTLFAEFEEESVTPPDPSHTHTWATAWSKDTTHHWRECTALDCDITDNSQKDGYAPHTPGGWIVDTPATSSKWGQRHKECTVCGYITQTETIPATGGGGSSGSGDSSGGGTTTMPTQKPSIEDSTGGSTTVTPVRPGETATIRPKPDEGYEVEKITVTDQNGKPVEVTKKPDGTYTFKQPRGKVTIEVTYQPIDQPWSNPFADASEGDWYYEAVRFVQERGLMNGYSDGRFGPNDTLSRAQLAQILFNKEGRPGVNYLLDFSDVAGEAWYTEAVRWATSQGIVGGYGNGTFGPNAPITREQLAVMLWRYSGSPAATNKELHFNDMDEISGFALEAMRWAVENGILNGYGDGQLGPQGQATRAQVAQMLKNFIENQEDNI